MNDLTGKEVTMIYNGSSKSLIIASEGRKVIYTDPEWPVERSLPLGSDQKA